MAQGRSLEFLSTLLSHRDRWCTNGWVGEDCWESKVPDTDDMEQMDTILAQP